MSYLRPEGRGIKLHLGCGDYWLDGYINIDQAIYGGTDLILDIREKLPFQDSVVEVIEAHDVLEHFNKYELDRMLPDWKRLLIPGGKVVITVPDLDEYITMYNSDRDKAMLHIYGIDDSPGHKWGYTQNTLKELFEKYGFKDVIVEKTIVEWRPEELKLRLICQK